MSLGRGILFIALVIPGLLVAISSLYTFNTEYAELGRSERYTERLVRDQRASDRQFELAFHRSDVHRINAYTNGSWGFIGALIAAIGVHGIATTQEEMIQDQKRASK
ncbi:MAG: hypothetical protein SAK29_21590 [Scytonema sp. PMC 1069.18]|nr:hypothetical protein [Scytonema sp. PMC 1069.18]MEC4885781.1 hypothetical protein [Scytonema sp. PMC 1070.18]